MLNKHYRVTYRVKNLFSGALEGNERTATPRADTAADASLIVGLDLLEQGVNYRIIKIEEITANEQVNPDTRRN